MKACLEASAEDAVPCGAVAGGEFNGVTRAATQNPSRWFLKICKGFFTSVLSAPHVSRDSMRYFSLFLLVCAPVLSAQTFSVGAKGGIRLTEPAGRADESRLYVVGPSLEVGFGRFGIEANALYSRFGTASLSGDVRGHSVEFPVLGKFYFTERRSAARPYASSGFAFRNIWFDDVRSSRFGNRRVNSTDPAVGAVVAGGVTFNAWALKLSPEVRYTRWGGFNSPATNPNQVQALLGITF